MPLIAAVVYKVLRTLRAVYDDTHAHKSTPKGQHFVHTTYVCVPDTNRKVPPGGDFAGLLRHSTYGKVMVVQIKCNLCVCAFGDKKGVTVRDFSAREREREIKKSELIHHDNNFFVCIGRETCRPHVCVCVCVSAFALTAHKAK